MNFISFSVKLSESDFIKFQFYNFYRSRGMIFITVIGIGWLSVGLKQFFLNENANSPLVSIAIGLSLLIFLPIILYRSSKKTFRSNKNLQESITYSLDEDELKVQGATFNSSVTVNNIHRFREMKNWVLIYHSNLTFNLIPKTALSTEDLDFIRSVFKK